MDPLNPHAIAATRRSAYTRYTLTSLVQCLLEYADSEFTADSVESIARARMLYSTALQILDTTELRDQPYSGSCNGIIGRSTKAIVREPSYVALSSAINATGTILQLNPESSIEASMLMPFENSGVETRWELQMPKAANNFDYRTIADVLITIDYTALDSFDYRQQVIQSLSPTLSSDISYSFRNQFPDQWYDLHNPDQTSIPMVVRFTTSREDFPPNLENLRIQQVLLYFVCSGEESLEFPISYLKFNEDGSRGSVGGAATAIEGIISTLRGNAASWTPMISKTPFGEWELALPNTDEIRNKFKNDELQDILFVITYGGHTPSWPI